MKKLILLGVRWIAHMDAVNLFERYAKGDDNVELKAWAGKTVPAPKHHKDMADKLK